MCKTSVEDPHKNKHKGIPSQMNPTSLWITTRQTLMFVPANDHNQQYV